MAVTVAALLAVAGCSSDDGNESAAKSKPAVKLSKKWTPKIEAVQEKAPANVCSDPGAAACAEHLTDIVLVVYDLRDAIDEQHLKGRYPRAVKRIGKIDRASTAYSKHECKGDPKAGMDGSPCNKHVADILAGSGSLMMEMVTDEAKSSSG